MPGVVVPEEDVRRLARRSSGCTTIRTRSSGLALAGRRRVMEAYTDAAVAERTLGFWRDLLRATA